MNPIVLQQVQLVKNGAVYERHHLWYPALRVLGFLSTLHLRHSWMSKTPRATLAIHNLVPRKYSRQIDPFNATALNLLHYLTQEWPFNFNPLSLKVRSGSRSTRRFNLTSIRPLPLVRPLPSFEIMPCRPWTCPWTRSSALALRSLLRGWAASASVSFACTGESRTKNTHIQGTRSRNQQSIDPFIPKVDTAHLASSARKQRMISNKKLLRNWIYDNNSRSRKPYTAHAGLCRVVKNGAPCCKLVITFIMFFLAWLFLTVHGECPVLILNE